MTTLASVLPYACLGLLAVGLFGFVESLPLWAPRESLAERLQQLEPEYWANLAKQQHSAALRPVRVGHSILRPVVDELGRHLQTVLARFGIVGTADLQQRLDLVRPGVPPAQHFGEKVVLGLIGLGVLPICEAIGIHPFGAYPIWMWQVTHALGMRTTRARLRRGFLRQASRGGVI